MYILKIWRRPACNFGRYHEKKSKELSTQPFCTQISKVTIICHIILSNLTFEGGQTRIRSNKFKVMSQYFSIKSSASISNFLSIINVTSFFYDAWDAQKFQIKIRHAYSIIVCYKTPNVKISLLNFKDLQNLFNTLTYISFLISQSFRFCV